MVLASSDEAIKKGSGNATRHVLYVDDEPDLFLSVGEPDLFLSVGELLRHNGFKVTTYANGDEAVKIFKVKEFDLLLADIQMPGMGGYELYRKVHEIDASIKVCFFTGHNEYGEQFRTQYPTMDEKCFVTKPISPRQLADRLSSI